MENEFFNQVKQEVTEYGKSLAEVGKLRLIGIISRVLGLFLLILTVILCGMALLAFASVAVINALATCLPVWAAALIVGSVFLLIIVVAVLCRKPLFVHPFIKLLSKQIRTEEELALKTLEAEHKVELQQVHIQCEVENVTREVDFYASLLKRAWNWLTAKLAK